MEAAPILGRSDELAAIDVFLAVGHEDVAPQSGGATGGAVPPRTLVISGPAGIGKTTIWTAAVERARHRADRPRLLIARATEAEARMAYVTLTDLLEPVVDAAATALPALQRAALDAAMLRAVAPTTPDPRTTGTAVLGILRTLAARAGEPVVVGIDDAQWVDPASTDALAFALRRLDGEVRTIVTVRTAPEDPGPARSPGLVAALRAIGGVIELPVGPVSLGVLHHLIADRVGTTLTRPQLVRLETASAGNALLAIEIARELSRRDRWPSAAEPLPVPADTAALLGERITRLSVQDRELLFLVAATTSPTADDLHDAAGSLGASDIVDAGLARLHDTGLLATEPDGRIRFIHPLMAAAAVEAVTPDRRRAIHAALARIADSAEDRGRHVALATDEPSADAAHALDAAAAAARRRGATTMAAEWAEQAARVTPTDDATAQAGRRIRAARWFAEAGELIRAKTLLTATIDSLPPGDTRARARLTLSPILGWDHGAAIEVETCTAALEEATDPTLRARLYLRLAFHQDHVGVTGALEAAESAIATLSAIESTVVDQDLVACALLQRAALRLSAGIAIDEAEVDRAIALLAPEPRADADGDVHDESLRAHAMINDHLVDLDRLAEGRDRYVAQLERDLARGVDRPIPIGACELALIELWLGDWAAADAYAERSMAVALQAGGSAQNRSAALSARAMVDAHRGDLDAAEGVAREGAALSEGADDWNALRHAATLGHVALSRGDAAAATAVLGSVFDRCRERGDREMLGQRFVGDLLESAAAVGDVGRLREVTAALEASVATVPRPWVRTMAAKGRALLAATTNDLDDAEARIGEALAAAVDLPMPFEVARLHLVAGRIARRRKERRRAADHLELAITTFRGLGAARWIEIAAAEAARTGRRAATTDGPDGIDRLTETEDRVARLAARGLTNREVGEAAFLTPKSVEGVLARVYGKLGIRSRAELGAWLAGKDGTDTPGGVD